MSEWLLPAVIFLRELKRRKMVEEEKKKEELERVIQPVREREEEEVKPIKDTLTMKKVTRRSIIFEYHGRGKIYDMQIILDSTDFSAEIRSDNFSWKGTMSYLMELSPADVFLKAIPVNNDYLLGIENVEFDHYFCVVIDPTTEVLIKEARILGYYR